MKVDQDYLRRLLTACQDADSPTFDIVYLQRKGFDYEDDKFEFHFKILADQGFVARDNGSQGIGLQKGIDGHKAWSVIQLRLTASGHDFIEALSNAEVWNTIKSQFKDASITTLTSVAKQLLEGYLKKKVNSLLD